MLVVTNDINIQETLRQNKIETVSYDDFIKNFDNFKNKEYNIRRQKCTK